MQNACIFPIPFQPANTGASHSSPVLGAAVTLPRQSNLNWPQQVYQVFNNWVNKLITIYIYIYWILDAETATGRSQETSLRCLKPAWQIPKAGGISMEFVSSRQWFSTATDSLFHKEIVKENHTVASLGVTMAEWRQGRKYSCNWTWRKQMTLTMLPCDR